MAHEILNGRAVRFKDDEERNVACQAALHAIDRMSQRRLSKAAICVDDSMCVKEFETDFYFSDDPGNSRHNYSRTWLSRVTFVAACAAAKIDDSALRLEVALRTRSDEAGKVAVKRITDANTLARVARAACLDSVRIAAIGQISDFAILDALWPDVVGRVRHSVERRRNVLRRA